MHDKPPPMRPPARSHTEHDSVPRAPLVPHGMPVASVIPAQEIPARLASVTSRVDEHDYRHAETERRLVAAEAELVRLRDQDAVHTRGIAAAEQAYGEVLAKVSAVHSTQVEMLDAANASKRASEGAQSASVSTDIQVTTLAQRSPTKRTTWTAPLVAGVLVALAQAAMHEACAGAARTGATDSTATDDAGVLATQAQQKDMP